jgi:hypothetical protein
MQRLLISFLALLLPISGLAADYGLGAVADNLMQPVQLATNFIAIMSTVVGISCLFASFIKYTQHRINPLAVPISVVVLLLLMGIILLSLPLIYKLSESGIPVKFF